MRPRATSRDDIDHIALQLFLTHGYDDVTTAAVIDACGISRATFFRYVSSRDALVLDHIASFGEDVATAVGEHPAEDAWTAMREAMCTAIESLAPDSHAGMAFRILQSSPGIRSSALELTRAWRHQLTEALVSRSDFAGNALRCEAAAAMAIGLFQMTWAQSNPTTATLRDAFNDAYALTRMTSTA